MIVDHDKQDRERAEAVCETIWRSLDARVFPSRYDIYEHVALLVDAFRAARGELPR